MTTTNKTSKHTPMKSTPGPWKCEYGMVFDECGHGIAKMDRDEPATSPTERDCNARLISLAWMLPEMVEALTSVMNLVDEGVLVRDTSKDHEPTWAMAQIPLVKALATARAALARYHEQEESK